MSSQDVERSKAPQADPLPSWNDGDLKQSILEFVRSVTDQNGPDHVPPAPRIAVFDNDGTLWAEQPLYVQLAPARRNRRRCRTKTNPTKRAWLASFVVIPILAVGSRVLAQSAAQPGETPAASAGDTSKSDNDKPKHPDEYDHVKVAARTDIPPAYILPDVPRGWNQFNSRYASLTLSLAPIVDYTAFVQDEDSKTQVGQAENEGELRAGRTLITGDIKFKRPLHYMLSVEYNGLDREPESPGWGVTDLSFSILLSKKLGNLSFGKMKEPFIYEVVGDSANLPSLERILSPFFKTRNIGVKLSNAALKERMTWSVGWFNDWFSNGEPFDQSGNQFSSRVTGLAYISDGGDRYLHFGGSGRYSGPERGNIRLRGLPESNVAPIYVDTGDIPADHQTELAVESLWTHGPYSLLSEYVRSWVDSPQTGSPTFYGLYTTATWTITGEHRPYDRRIGYARRIIPERRWGAWELVARYSHLDLDDRTIRGGIMDKGFLGLNWWASRQWKIAFGYGLANLNRSDRNGLSHIFLTRFQWIFF